METMECEKIMGQKMKALEPHEVINLSAYPIIDTSSSAFAALVKELRDTLDAQQYVVLPEFILPAARQQAVTQIQDMLHSAHHNTTLRNCYLEHQKDPSLPDDHPKNIGEWEAQGGIGIHHTSVNGTIAKLKKLGFA